MSWMTLSLIGSFCIGLFGKLLFENIDDINPETIFLLSADKLFPSWLSGVVLAAVLAAIMSTISAQLHAIACSLTEAISLKVLEKYNKILITRVIMFLVILISLVYASNPKNTILGLVSLAWAGLGSAFGPTILFSLYSKKMTKVGALSGVIIGGLVVVIWHSLKPRGGIFELYEIIPGFILSSLAIALVNNIGCKK
jgi:sodium/proline symporter